MVKRLQETKPSPVVLDQTFFKYTNVLIFLEGNSSGTDCLWVVLRETNFLYCYCACFSVKWQSMMSPLQPCTTSCMMACTVKRGTLPCWRVLTLPGSLITLMWDTTHVRSPPPAYLFKDRPSRNLLVDSVRLTQSTIWDADIYRYKSL